MRLVRQPQNIWIAGDFSTATAQESVKDAKWQESYLIALRFVYSCHAFKLSSSKVFAATYFRSNFHSSHPVICDTKRGRPRHLWVSASTALRLDATRDFKDMGVQGVQIIDGAAGLDAGSRKLFGKPKKR